MERKFVGWWYKQPPLLAVAEGNAVETESVEADTMRKCVRLAFRAIRATGADVEVCIECLIPSDDGWDTISREHRKCLSPSRSARDIAQQLRGGAKRGGRAKAGRRHGFHSDLPCPTQQG